MIDAHAHLDFEAFDADREAMWARALEAGVEAAVIPGVAPAQWARGAEVARALDGAWCVGAHPEWLAELGLSPDALRERLIAEGEGAVAVGELGLDRRVEGAVGREAQEAYLEAQLDAAEALGLPLVLHVVGRHGRLLELLGPRAPLRGMVHAFTGAPEVAARYLELGLHLGVGGALTRPNAKKLRAAAPTIPLGRLLVETDAPDQAPEGREGRNEPAWLVDVVEALAALRGESVEKVAEATGENARTLFGLAS